MLELELEQILTFPSPVLSIVNWMLNQTTLRPFSWTVMEWLVYCFLCNFNFFSEDEDANMVELKFIPDDQDSIDEIFLALSDGAACINNQHFINRFEKNSTSRQATTKRYARVRW